MSQVPTKGVSIAFVMSRVEFKQGMTDFLLGEWDQSLTDGPDINKAWTYERGRLAAAAGLSFWSGRPKAEQVQAYARLAYQRAVI